MYKGQDTNIKLQVSLDNPTLFVKCKLLSDCKSTVGLLIQPFDLEIMSLW